MEEKQRGKEVTKYLEIWIQSTTNENAFLFFIQRIPFQNFIRYSFPPQYWSM